MSHRHSNSRAASDVRHVDILQDAFYAKHLTTGLAYTVLDLAPESGMTTRFVILRSQANQPRELFRLLDDAGVPWVGKQGRLAVLDRVRAAPLRPEAVITSQTGWHGSQYVCGDGTVLGKGREIVLRSPGAPVTMGDLDGWRRGVACTASFSSTISTMMSAAFAATMMRKVGAPSVILNFFGTSSSGKSSGARAGLSADRNPDDLGNWDGTPTAIEEAAARHNDSAFYLDEMGQAAKSAEDVAAHVIDTAFRISARRGRSRSVNYAPEGTARLVVLGISTGELSVTDYARAGGRRRIAGDAVRVIDIPIEVAEGKGVFDRLDDSLSSNKQRASMDNATAQHYGVAKREFISRFLEDEKDSVKRVKQWMELFREKADISDELWEGRFGNVFALLYAAARLAARFDILPWTKDFIFDVVNLHYQSARAAAPVPKLDATAELARVIYCLTESENFVSADEFADYDGSTEEFDGFTLAAPSFSSREDDLIYAVKRSTLQRWLGNTVGIVDFGRLLRVKNLIETESQDVSTVQIKIEGIQGRRRYYCFSQQAIMESGIPRPPGRAHRR